MLLVCLYIVVCHCLLFILSSHNSILWRFNASYYLLVFRNGTSVNYAFSVIASRLSRYIFVVVFLGVVMGLFWYLDVGCLFVVLMSGVLMVG